jgi:hypothetical protein
MYKINSEKRSFSSSVAVGHSVKSDTSPCNQKSVQSTVESSKKREVKSVEEFGDKKKKKAKNYLTKVKKDKKMKSGYPESTKSESKAKVLLVTDHLEETGAGAETETVVEDKDVTDLTLDEEIFCYRILSA